MSHTITKGRYADLKRLTEVNYNLLLKLIPDIQRVRRPVCSTVTGCADIHLRLIEHTPYTTTVALTHYFWAGAAPIAAPDVHIRMYHDAKVAEAVPGSDGSTPAHARLYTPNKAPDPLLKWQLNHFLEKWLRYCLSSGHRLLIDEIEDGDAHPRTLATP